MQKKQKYNTQTLSQLTELLNKHTGEIALQKESFLTSMQRLKQEGKPQTIPDIMSQATSTIKAMSISFHTLLQDLKQLESERMDTPQDLTLISQTRNSLSKEADTLRATTEIVQLLEKMTQSLKDTSSAQVPANDATSAK